MAGAFEISHETLTGAATGVERARTQLQSHTTSLRATVDGAGNPWGADEQGSLFGQLYTAALGHVLQVMESHQAELDYAAQSLSQSARVYADTDHGVAGRFDSLNAEV